MFRTKEEEVKYSCQIQVLLFFANKDKDISKDKENDYIVHLS